MSEELPRLHPTWRGSSDPVRSAPSVSIVIPVRNEAKYIEACVTRLLDQDYPQDRIEIIVIDGRSEDATVEILHALQRGRPEATLRILHNPTGTIPVGLNIGIRAARGEIIMRFDGHSIPSDDYVSAAVAALEASGAANVGGVVQPIGDTPFGTAVAAAMKHPIGVGNARFRTGGAAGDVDTVPFGTFSREVFESVGLFDESLDRNEDYEMNIRIRAAGRRVFLDPAIQLLYTPRASAGGLWRQYFQNGWWRVETARRHAGSLRWRQVIPPVFVAVLLLLAMLAPWSTLSALPLLLLSTIYLGTVTAASWSLAKGNVSPLLIATALVTMHVAFGLGFICNVLSRGSFPFRSRAPHVPRLEVAT